MTGVQFPIVAKIFFSSQPHQDQLWGPPSPFTTLP